MPLSLLHDFIWQHREDDPQQLALSAKKYPHIPISVAARQIQALQKIRHKIPSWYQPGMESPLAISLEQASSERTAQFKSRLFSGKTMVDLTGGLGVDAFFFSQQFESLVYVEQNGELLAAARHNFAALGVNNVQFEHSTAEDFLTKSSQEFDLIYLDPARRDGQGGRVAQLADCSPNVLNIKDLLLKKSNQVLIKTAPMLDLKLAAEQLGQVKKIWVLASEGDCREVLYLLERNAQNTLEIPIQSVNLMEPDNQVFEFSWAEEIQAETVFSPPQQFLYEPNPAVLKAGAFRTFGQRFGLSKLHPNTHLYTSNSFIPDLPGRSFSIEQVCKYERKSLQAAIIGGKANITCRNFPENPDQVRKKLGLADGGELYLFAATDANNKKIIMVCRKT